MTDRKIDLKNQWAAGILAWLIPGAGHAYQKRYFKSAVYFICIFGTFLFGMQMGEWRALHWTEWNEIQLPKRNWGFLLQAGNGAPAVFAFLQTRRASAQENQPTDINTEELWKPLRLRSPRQNEIERSNYPSNPLPAPVEGEFTGVLADLKQDGGTTVGRLTGTVHLEPTARSYQGTFEGTLTLDSGETKSVSYQLGHALHMDRRIEADPRRRVVAHVLSNDNPDLAIDGSIPRSFVNWFATPPNQAVLADLHLRLNKRYEMAIVFTWIAGLLNILAIWDAVQGPAYGFGDEPPEEDDPKKKAKSNTETDSPASTKGDDQSEPQKELASAAVATDPEPVPESKDKS